MDCQKIKKLLNPYIDGTLDKEITIQVEEHLKSCSNCQEEYLELEETVSSLNFLSSQYRPVPADFTQNIMVKISRERIQIKSSWIDHIKKQIAIPKFSFRLAGVGAATAAILFFAFTFVFNVPATSPLCSSEVNFSLKLGDNENHVIAIAGDFNNWNTKANLLEDSDGNGTWTSTLKLEPGRYEYMFVLDGKQWVPDPNAIRYVKDGFGNRNSILEINSCSST